MRRSLLALPIVLAGLLTLDVRLRSASMNLENALEFKPDPLDSPSTEATLHLMP